MEGSMKNPVNQWTCGACPNTGTSKKPPHFIPAPDQPLAGTRIGVCDACYKASRAANNVARKTDIVGTLTSPPVAQTSEGAETAESGAGAYSAPTTGDRPQEVSQVGGTCERCHGAIPADGVRRRKPRTTCSDRCRVALWHARKKEKAAA